MRHLPAIFSLTLFGSALLSFSIQPILGKMLLPMVGGTPAGWIVALAFFQLSLLAGYGISYFLGRFSAWVHALGLVALYVAGICYLPPALPQISYVIQGADLSFAVTKALFTSIFIPFLALTATTAALQRVFAASRHNTASDPYYLFVASNIGSFVGLLAYPFLLEPFIGISDQSNWWRMIYFAVISIVILSVLLSFLCRRQQVEIDRTAIDKAAIDLRRLGLWLALAFIPCSLSMGVTTLITQDLGAFPLFWIIPLGLYLLTFVLAFAKRQLIPAAELAFWHQVSVVFCFVLVIITLQGFSWDQSLTVFIIKSAALLLIFFMIAWACHQRLADMRPSTDKLPQFYFVLALGGALAGILHAFVLPYVLKDIIEFNIAVAFSLLLNLDWSKKYKAMTLGRVTLTANRTMLVALILLAVSVVLHTVDARVVTGGSILFLFMIFYFLSALQPKQAFVLTMALLVATIFVFGRQDIIFQGRNFFGTYRVMEKQAENQDTIRYLAHGSTIHGMSITDKSGREMQGNFGYYVHNGPINDVLSVTNARQFGVLGLGAGQLACFSPKVKTDFFEIDPDMVDIAKAYFPYLKKCPPRQIFIGDGRIEIAKSKMKYDVILQDAFTSDGIPMHLLTAEAFEQYKAKISPHGVMLFHISNRYLNLAPPIAATSAKIGLGAYIKNYQPSEEVLYSLHSSWVAVPLNASQGRALEQKGWKKLETASQPWTDDKSSLISALSLTF